MAIGKQHTRGIASETARRGAAAGHEFCQFRRADNGVWTM